MPFSKTELIREKEFRRCKGSAPDDFEALVYWAEKYAYIQHPERGAIIIELRSAQLDILETWMSERYSICLKARQVGWSTLVALYCLWLAFFWADQTIVMLSKGDREAQKLLAKATYAYQRLPDWMKQRGPTRTSRNVKKLSFDNASVIESLPSKEDPARGTAVSLVVVDEWAFLDNPEDAWASIEPIADVGGRVIGLSTANGWGEFFHTFWVRATTGVSNFVPKFFPWSANDERDDEWYENKQRNLLPWQMAQEYPTTEEEAFIKSGNAFFDVEALGRIETREPMVGILDTTESGTRKAPRFIEQSSGDFRVWELPNVGEAYVIGGDVAEGLEHGDFSSAHVISLRHDQVVATWHGHIDPDVFAERLFELGYFYNVPLLGVESNNHGLTTLKALQRMGYPRIFRQRTLTSKTERETIKLGWYTSHGSKPLLMDELARALRNELVVEDALTIAELRTYVRDAKGHLNGSPFDDRVMSLAIANRMREYASQPEYALVEERYGTWDYYMHKVLHEDPDAEEFYIGGANTRSSFGSAHDLLAG